MSDRRTILAIDLGTQSLRASAVVADGTRTWWWQEPVETFADGERQEQDPEAWRRLLHRALRDAARDGVRPAVIAASGPLAGFVPVAADGRSLANAAMYNDMRTAGAVARVEAALGTALANVPRVAIADPLPHALRLRDEAPAILAAAAHLLDATGWLAFELTGVATLNSYTAIRLYTPAVRDALGLADTPFGRRVETGERIGALQARIAEPLGWGLVNVVAAPFDSKCAYLGSAISAPGDALDISGTVTSFGVVADGEVRDPEQRIYSVPFSGRHLVRGSTAAAGSVLEWAADVFGLGVEELDRHALAAPLAPEDPVFVPYLSGARAPLWRPMARGSLTDLSIATRRDAVARAIYAGLALSLRHIVETVETCGVAVGPISLAGGLARSAALSQIKADVLGRPVTTLRDTELTTVGLSAIGATALGAYPAIADAARHFSRPEATYAPRLPRATADVIYARYVRAATASASPPSGAIVHRVKDTTDDHESAA